MSVLLFLPSMPTLASLTPTLNSLTIPRVPASPQMAPSLVSRLSDRPSDGHFRLTDGISLHPEAISLLLMPFIAFLTLFIAFLTPNLLPDAIHYLSIAWLTDISHLPYAIHRLPNAISRLLNLSHTAVDFLIVPYGRPYCQLLINMTIMPVN